MFNQLISNTIEKCGDTHINEQLAKYRMKHWKKKKMLNMKKLPNTFKDMEDGVKTRERIKKEFRWAKRD
jgi:hypothetical protein